MEYEKKIFGINVNLIKLSGTLGKVMNINEAISRSFVAITIVLLTALLLYAVENVHYDYMTTDVIVIPAILFAIVTLVYCLSKMVNNLNFGGIILVPATILSITFLFITIPPIGIDYNSPEEIRIMYEVYSKVLIPYVVYLLGFGIVKSILGGVLYRNVEPRGGEDIEE